MYAVFSVAFTSFRQWHLDEGIVISTTNLPAVSFEFKLAVASKRASEFLRI